MLMRVKNMVNIKEFETMMMLDLPDGERDSLGKRLDALDKSFSALEQADTNGVEPLVTVLSVNNVLRDDVSEKLLPRDEILANAPERDGGFFKVPGTLDAP